MIQFDYKPIPVHVPFHVCPAYERFLFGAFGSGKTWAICAEAIAWCLEVPGIRGLIARKTVPELRDTTEKEFFSLLPHELREAGEIRRTGGHVESFTFPNGAEVLFRAIDEWEKYKSMNLGFIAWDEMDEFDEETYNGMKSRVRQRQPTPRGQDYGATEITKRGIWGASNPAGHNWCWRVAVNPATQRDGVEHFTSTSFDNPFLPPGFIETLLQYPDQWVKRYVLCQFDDFAGQIYDQWGWDSHVLKQPLNLGPHTLYWMGMDPGTRNPTFGLWVAVDLDGSIGGTPRSLIGVAEYESPYRSAEEHAREWKQIEAQKRMNVKWRVSDPNSLPVKDRGSNMGLDEQYRRLGYYFNLGPSRHDDRIPMLGQLINMKRFLLTPDCPITFEAIKNYKWEDLSSAMKKKEVDAPERPLKKDDHPVDCAQYLASRWVKPPRSLLKRPERTHGEEVTRMIKKQLRAELGPAGAQGVIV